MKHSSKFIFAFLFTLYFSMVFSQKNPDQAYIFFLHNKFIEENDLNVAHPEYGKAEYNEIINSFKASNFIVFSEKRKKNTNGADYAEKIVKQIKGLLKKALSQIKLL